jgi:hypothetical protein
MMIESYLKNFLICAVSVVLNVVSVKCADGYRDEQDTWDEDIKRLLQYKCGEKHNTWDEDTKRLLQYKFGEKHDTWDENTKRLFQSRYSKECEEEDTWDEDIELMKQGLPISSSRRNDSPKVTDPSYRLNFLASVAALQDHIPIIESTPNLLLSLVDVNIEKIVVNGVHLRCRDTPPNGKA